MLSNKAEQDMERTYGPVHVNVEGDLTFHIIQLRFMFLFQTLIL